MIFRLMKTVPALNGCYWGGAAGWLAGWLCWRLWRSAKTSGDRLTRWLPRGRLLWLSPLMVALAATALTFVFRHPLMPVYLAILHKVIAR